VEDPDILKRRGRSGLSSSIGNSCDELHVFYTGIGDTLKIATARRGSCPHTFEFAIAQFAVVMGRLKTQDLTSRDWTTRHHIARVNIAMSTLAIWYRVTYETRTTVPNFFTGLT